MTRFNQLLVGLFAVQIVVTAGLYFGSQPPATQQVQSNLLNVETQRVARITIDKGDGKQTVLSKVDGRWQLPEYHQLPAVQGKVEQVLEKLRHTKLGWPVATTAASRERFEVADDHYQTRITLADGDKTLETLYLGTSPGFRQLHVRHDKDKDVYQVKLNSYDFPADSQSWLDKTLLQPGDGITHLKGPDYALSKQGEKWTLVDGDGELIKDEVEKLVTALSQLKVESAAEKTADKPEYQVTVNAGDKVFEYRFYKQDKDYLVVRNDYNQAFKINKADFDKITGQNAIRLVKHENKGEQPTTVNSEKKVAPKQSLDIAPEDGAPTGEAAKLVGAVP